MSELPKSATLGMLFLAAVLESTGDFVMKNVLVQHSMAVRIGLLSLGAVVLTCYGLAVNTPRWDFGRLLGIYVGFFFVCAQTIACVDTKTKPSTGIVLGAILILSGSAVITFFR